MAEKRLIDASALRKRIEERIREFDSETYAARRYPKYTITVDDFGELLPDPKLSAEREYRLLRIPRSDGRFELVSTSLVEIEYY